MVNTQLYFETTTKTELKSLPDALNRELQVGDFVTAVFKNGELTLFKIIGFEKHKIDHFMDYDQLNYTQKGIVLTRTDETNYIVLHRVNGTNAFSKRNDKESKKLNAKLVYKTSKQTAYADPNFVMMHFLQQ
jgi:hypothetical protein